MSQPASEFPLFSKLPLEIREEIWQYCLPARVCEIDTPHDQDIFWQPEGEWPYNYGSPPNYDPGPWPCELMHTTYMNSRPPLISRICRESRRVAFSQGRIRDSFEIPEGASGTDVIWSGGLANEMVWEDRIRDSVHLNYLDGCTNLDDWIGQPLSGLAHEGSLFSSRASFLHRQINRDIDLEAWAEDWSAGFTPYADNTPYQDCILNAKKAIQQLPRWLIVMRLVVIHSDVKAAIETGFFGLTGDCRVLVISAHEKERVNALYDFAKACESHYPVRAHQRARQNFHRDAVEVMEERLRRDCEEEFGSEAMADFVTPAIMFRLCTLMCNHADPKARPGRDWRLRFTKPARVPFEDILQIRLALERCHALFD